MLDTPQGTEEKRRLCVDLDGTLLRSDSLQEALCAVLRRNLFDARLLPVWLSKGKAYFKQRVYERADIDIERLPFREDLVELLKAELRRGRPLTLATAAPQSFARKVAEHLGLFDTVLGSDETVNLAGEAKAQRLIALYGEKGFDYAGNSRIDLQVWKHAASAWVVSNDAQLIKAAGRSAPIEKSLSESTSAVKVLTKALRIHQWAKNLLIFLPILLSDAIFDLSHWILSILGFFSFSFIASSVYILNDLLDIEADRRHPDNRKRPFAAGTLSIGAGLSLIPLLLSAGLSIGALLSPSYLCVILGYFAMTCLYSLRVKQIVMADIIILSVLYTWRVLAGGIVTGTPISEWFLTFALFFFISLALLKRCSELILMEQNRQKKNSRRGYTVSDLPLLVNVGVANGYLSVLVLALYINDPKVASHMRYPGLLWAFCPVLLYWISRMWLKAYRGVMHTDPLVFALKDRTSYMIVLVAGALWLLARGVIFLSFPF